MPFSKPVGLTDVYVDDYIQAGQGGPNRMKALRRHLWHQVDRVLAPPDVSEHKRNEAISLKKLRKGDGCWTTRKVILGWIIDTLRQTLEIPGHRKVELTQLLSSLCKARRISRKRYEKALGKLRFVAEAIPGAKGLFGTLQMALQQATEGRIKMTPHLKDHLYSFARIAADLRDRPTHLAELIPQEPSFLGTTDAAKPGMGGVYFDSNETPYLWRFPMPELVKERWIAADNPEGTITNSDLEHAAALAQVSLISHRHDTQCATITTGMDNTPAISRVAKGAVADEGPASHLCIYACEHQRQHRYYHSAQFLSGLRNRMADDASRLQHLTDASFLAHFEQHYPQAQPWVLLHLPHEIASKLTSALLALSPPRPTLPKRLAPRPMPLITGPPSASSKGSPLPSVISKTQRAALASFSSTDSDTDAKAAPVTLSALIRWQRHSRPWPRGSPTWVNPILGKQDQETNFIPYSKLSLTP